MDVNRALRSAAQTGKVLLGEKETKRAIAEKVAKLVVLAENTPAGVAEKVQELAKKNNVPVYKFQGRNTDLGPACGKPFSVAILSILEAGESDVLALARGA
ncbi:MAG: 50S ribosomal protein L30e [Thermoplasmatota archaeon]